MSSILSQENLIFLFVVVLMDIIHPTAGKFLVSSVVPMDVLHPVAGNQKKILFVVVLMDVIHPITGKSSFFLLWMSSILFQEHYFFPPFGSSHGCYSSILLQKLSFPPPSLFIVPMDVVHPICKEINSLFWYTGTDYLLYPLDVILFVAQNFLFNNINKCTSCQC